MKKKKKIERNVLSESEKARVMAYFQRNIRRASDGSRGQVNYEATSELFRYIYGLEKLPPPVVIVAKNFFEMQLMKNLLFILIKHQQPEVSKQMFTCLSARRNNAPISEVKSLTEHLYQEVYPLCAKMLSHLSQSSVSIEDLSLKPYLRPYLFNALSVSKIFFSAMHSTPHLLEMGSDYIYAISEILELRGSSIPQEISYIRSLRESANIMYHMTCKDFVFVCPYPKKILFNAQGRLHSTTTYAVQVDTSHPIFHPPYYFINGRFVHNPKLITDGFTLIDFITTQNEEERAFMFEIVSEKSPNAIIDFFNLIEVDKTTITHIVDVPHFDMQGNFIGESTEIQQEEIILYHTKSAFPDVKDPLNPSQTHNKLAWIKFTCPSTKTVYMIYTSPSFKKAIDAASYAQPFQQKNYTWNYRS